jgi:riboflavin synthase
MFTGIIEALGTVNQIKKEGSNLNFNIKSVISNALKIDQSISHNGVCLTVTKVEGDSHWVTAIDETLQKSNLSKLIVQGHVDQTGIVKSIKEVDGSWLYDFEFDESTGNVTVEKGSISVNGVSLTCFNSTENTFSVAIIPYTHNHTNFHSLQVGDTVNLEFDIIGKYVKRLLGK